MSGRTVQCSDCGALVKEVARIEDRQPCPTCGSLARTFGVTITDSVEAHDSTGLKARHGDVGKGQALPRVLPRGRLPPRQRRVAAGLAGGRPGPRSVHRAHRRR
jgi:hypothetical protein